MENKEYNYMLLDRLKSDCEYYLGNGNGSEKYLWADNVDEQITKMKELWNSFTVDEKPEWLSMEDIENYEKEMKGKKVQESTEAVDEHSFSSINFEKTIPFKMRWKEWDIVNDSQDLYWVTQQHFDAEEEAMFKEALGNTEFRCAYVIVRDDSTYNFEKDKLSKDMHTIINDKKKQVNTLEENTTNETEKSYRYITTHGVGPGTLPAGVHLIKSEDTKNYGRIAIYLSRPLTAEELRKYDIKPEWIQESKEVDNVSKPVKELDDWKTSIDKDFQIGDYVSQEVIDDIINTLPPKTMNSEVVQMGEPYSANKNGATYITFVKSFGDNKTEGQWMYVGALNKINRYDDYVKTLNESKSNMSNIEKFKEYCKNKIQDLGIETYIEDDTEEEVTMKVILIDSIREFEDAKVVVDFSEPDSGLQVIDDHRLVINTPMYSPLQVAASMEFKAIDEEFYDNIIENWEESMMDEIMNTNK